MTDVMCDIETTGLTVDSSAIIQIAAIKFNYETGEIGEVFDHCLAMAPNRYWDEDTRTWWMGKNRKVLEGIIDRMEDPGTVVRDFHAYALREAPHGGFRFWSKPTHFDFSRVESYMRQFGYPMPFHFRIARDLNTFLAARRGGAAHVEMPHIDVDGSAHNALVDCVYQLKLLFAARDGDWAQDREIVEEAEFTEVTA